MLQGPYEQEDFLNVYMQYIGETEVPDVYFRWSAISLVGAALANRVWLSKRVGAREVRVWPNLYILLLGPSGNGKSMACDAALSILRQTDYSERLNLYTGKVTAQAMYDEMYPGREGGKHFKPWKSQIYLVNDELANDVGKKDVADVLVKSLTRMYMGSPFVDSTRTSGTVRLDSPYCVNWFGCSTSEWLVGVLDRSAILGGFFARVQTINAGYTGRRIFEGVKPKGHEEREAWLVERINALLLMEGEFPRSVESREMEEHWYMERELPDMGATTGAGWRREHDLLLKLSLNRALQLQHAQVEGSDTKWALKMLDEATQVVPELTQMLTRTPQDQALADVLDAIKIATDGGGYIKHSRLLKYAYDRGIHADRLHAAMDTWEGAKLVEVVRKSNKEGGTVYRYILGRGKIVWTPEEVPDEEES